MALCGSRLLFGDPAKYCVKRLVLELGGREFVPRSLVAGGVVEILAKGLEKRRDIVLVIKFDAMESCWWLWSVQL